MPKKYSHRSDQDLLGSRATYHDELQFRVELLFASERPGSLLFLCSSEDQSIMLWLLGSDHIPALALGNVQMLVPKNCMDLRGRTILRRTRHE